jgi:hypothetical protein
MSIRKFVGGAAAVALAGLLGAAPAFAHTSQPATPEEMQQTDALNARALASAQGTTPTNDNMATPAPGTATAPGADTMTPPSRNGGNDQATMPGQSNASPTANGTTPSPAGTTNN